MIYQFAARSWSGPCREMLPNGFSLSRSAGERLAAVCSSCAGLPPTPNQFREGCPSPRRGKSESAAGQQHRPPLLGCYSTSANGTFTKVNAEPAMTDPDPNPFADCDVVVCYGGAKPEDKHLASIVHCIDDEIFEWLERREQRRARAPRVARRPAPPASVHAIPTEPPPHQFLHATYRL
jgi:hypothetical protein